MLPKTVHENKKSIDTENFTDVLFQEIATATAAFSNHHPDQLAAIEIKARPSTSKKIPTHWMLRWWLAFFSHKDILLSIHIIFFRNTVIECLIDY